MVDDKVDGRVERRGGASVFDLDAHAAVQLGQGAPARQLQQFGDFSRREILRALDQVGGLVVVTKSGTVLIESALLIVRETDPAIMGPPWAEPYDRSRRE